MGLSPTATTTPLPPSPLPPPSAIEQRQNQRTNREDEENRQGEEEEEEMEELRAGPSRIGRRGEREGEREGERDGEREEEDDHENNDYDLEFDDADERLYNVTHNVDIRKHYKRFLTAYSISPVHPHPSYMIEVKGLLQKAYEYIERHLKKEKCIKVHVTMLVNFYKIEDESIVDRQSQHFCLRSQIISLEYSLSDMMALNGAKIVD